MVVVGVLGDVIFFVKVWKNKSLRSKILCDGKPNATITICLGLNVSLFVLTMQRE